MAVSIYKLTNKNGISMKVTNLGCVIMTLNIPTKSGVTKDIVLGLDNAEDYKSAPYFLGAVIGRVANRIGNGKFTLGGKKYSLETNNGPHHLHGGSDGFDKKEWTVLESSDNKIVFEYISPSGESGYPGSLTACVTYTLTDANTLRIDYRAETDSETICNLTNHSYFNLEGHDAKDIYNHEMQMSANAITAVDETLIPTGEFLPVENTPFDFRTPKTIGKDIEKSGGYDHNYLVNGEPTPLTASVYSPITGIRMTLTTSSPGIQFYSGNFMDGSAKTKNGTAYGKHSGFCLETQIFPDAINKPNFPSPIVVKGKPQETFTEFAFEW